MKIEADAQDFLSFESCRSSAMDHVEGMSLEFRERFRREGDERKRRRCVVAGTRKGNGDARNQSCFERSGRRPRGP